MFSLFKKKPANAMDEFIFALYGNPPPAKRAQLDVAVTLACDVLLSGKVSRPAVAKLAAELHAGPIPYSTEDLALSVALAFFKKPELVPALRDAQLAARMQALDWFNDGKVVVLLVKTFEDTLYVLYKP